MTQQKFLSSLVVLFNVASCTARLITFDLLIPAKLSPSQELVERVSAANLFVVW